jgi:hypothetical protein
MCVMRLARLRSDAFFNTEETIFLVNEENCINESACVQETIIRYRLSLPGGGASKTHVRAMRAC